MSKEDCISALPCSLIQHILSFLPSTNEAIRPTVLSKSFHNQWTCVPVLKLHLSNVHFDKFTAFIDNTILLHDCSKIQKLHLQSNAYYDDGDPIYNPNWNVIINFAIKKDVKELILDFNSLKREMRLFLPESLFYHDSLVKLHIHACDLDLLPNGRVTWGHLKTLKIERCTLPPKAMENILCASPSLESLEITDSLEIIRFFDSPHFVIDSQSLKKLVLKDCVIYTLEISCPNLEELMIFGRFIPWARPVLMKSSSLICATLDFECSFNNSCQEIELLRQLHHVKKLKFGSRFIESLSGLEKLRDKLSKKRAYNRFLSLLNNVEIIGLSEKDDKSKLILNFIEVLLKNATVLDKLVVILKDGGDDFATKVSQKLLNYPRCSQHAVVELLCPN